MVKWIVRDEVGKKPSNSIQLDEFCRNTGTTRVEEINKRHCANHADGACSHVKIVFDDSRPSTRVGAKVLKGNAYRKHSTDTNQPYEHVVTGHGSDGGKSNSNSRSETEPTERHDPKEAESLAEPQRDRSDSLRSSEGSGTYSEVIITDGVDYEGPLDTAEVDEICQLFRGLSLRSGENSTRHEVSTSPGIPAEWNSPKGRPQLHARNGACLVYDLHVQIDPDSDQGHRSCSGNDTVMNVISIILIVLVAITIAAVIMDLI